MKKQIQAMLKGLKTKKSVVEVVRNFSTKDLTDEGRAIVEYLLNLFNSDMKDMTISEMKNEVLTLVQNNAFKDMNKATVIFENAIKPKKSVTVKVTEDEVEKLTKAMEKKSPKKETPKAEPKKEEGVKKLTPQEIFELCGYRYTYPVFPQKFTSPILEGKEFHRVDESDPKKVQEMYDAMLEGTATDLVVAMYFPEYERDFDIDPHAVCSGDTSKKQVLKKYGGKFPNDLDVQSILHFDGARNTLVTVSAFTGIPYAISCRNSLFETNEILKCRVTQNGLDYQIYQVK